MERAEKQLAILNLSGELYPELGEYFSSRGVEVIDPLVSEEVRDWTHIITKDIHNFDHIDAAYDLIQKDIRIISLSKVFDLQNFILNNGNMVLDEIWFKGPVGSFIMDKYFQGYGGISLGDNYPVFHEAGSFNITNPFSTGDNLDRLVHKAFLEGLEALTVKTYFDHLLMYISGLKAKGKAGIPYEVCYGTFEDVFAVQVHFFCGQLDMLDFSTSLRSSISKKVEEYLLNIAVQSSDFFDFTYMPDVSKVIITALWTKDERVKFENRGLMLTALNGNAVSFTNNHNIEASAVVTLSGPPIEDFSDKVVLPSSLPEGVTKTVVSGSELSDDEEKIIKGSKELEELVQLVKGKVEEDKSVFKVSGGKLDVDKAVFKIASSIEESTKEKNMTVRSLGEGLSQGLKTGLFDFAKGLNKNVEDLSQKELERFELKSIPEILKKELTSLSVRSISGANSEKTQESTLKLQTQLATSNQENEKLKSQLKTLASEVRILKETRNKIAEINSKVSEESADLAIIHNDSAAKEIESLQEKMALGKLEDQDIKKINAIIESLRENEKKVRKLELEASQKDIVLAQQLEKVQREVRSKDIVLLKSKESFTKVLEKKEKEISDLSGKVDQLTKTLSNSASANNSEDLRNLERQNQNLTKQIEIFKEKISRMATNLQPTKSEDNLKEEVRKLQMMGQQTKNQLDLSKKEIQKLQAKISSDNSQSLLLKQEKAKLEQELKKATFEAKERKAPPVTSQSDQELKRVETKNQLLETQLKDAARKITALEAKLAEASKSQKTVTATDDGSKVKLSKMEASVKKLGQDLIEAKNQVAEAKKESNKLRQEKMALQNQLDKAKKDIEKLEKAVPKKPGGKAA